MRVARISYQSKWNAATDACGEQLTGVPVKLKGLAVVVFGLNSLPGEHNYGSIGTCVCVTSGDYTSVVTVNECNAGVTGNGTLEISTH